MKVSLTGEKKGRWADFATEHHGDLLDLWRLKRNVSAVEAIKEVKQWCCINEPAFHAYKPSNAAKPKTTFQPLQSPQTLQPQSSVTQYLMQERCLSWQTLTTFKIAEKNNFIIFPYYHDHHQEPLMIKHLHSQRENHSKKIFVEPNGQPCLFGWQALPNELSSQATQSQQLCLREITLTEGELDAMSLFEYGIPALSLPFGGGTGNKHRWIDNEFERLSIFDKIYLCFDSDEVGRQTCQAVLERLGRHRCYVVTLPEKDTNACLQKGTSKGIINACFAAAKTVDPVELKSAHDYLPKVIELFYPNEATMNGYGTPWKKTKELMVFRPHELSIWTGINGHGKSQFLGFLLLHFMQQGARVCIASLEMKPERLLSRLTRQMSASTSPDVPNIESIHHWLSDKLWLFDLVGTAKTTRLLDVFLYARQRYGVDVFLLDSLLKCDIADDDYNGQKLFLDNLCDFKNEHPCHVHVVVHPRKASDETIVPGKLDIKGSGSISDLADNCFTIWRNKKKDNAKEPDCIWSCHKQRNGEWEGKFALWFDEKSYQYVEQPNDKAKPLIQFPGLSNPQF